MTPRSSVKRPQPLQLAELSERPTPRKLNVAPTTPKTPSTKRTAKPKGPTKDHPLISARKATTTTSHVRLSGPGAATANGTEPKGNGNKRVTIRPYPISDARINGLPHQPAKVELNEIFSTKLPNGSAMSISGDSCGEGSSPRKSSRVNGIVLQLDGINGTLSSSRPSSMADASEAAKKAPPKLKRKAPG